MKKIHYLFFAFIGLTILSCQKVIDINLNKADPKVVIEGYITEGDSLQTVSITRTLNFDETVAYPAVTDAVVIVTDNLGNSAAFTHAGNGVYTLSNFPGIAGRTYTLSVTVDGKNYTAQSTMPTPVVMNDLQVSLIPFAQDTFKLVVPVYNDPGNVANFYAFHLFKNGEKQGQFSLQDDQFTNGNTSLQPLFVDQLDLGDTIKVDMFGIEKKVWQYFNQLSVNTSNGTTPANPTSNFEGGCMGVFSAQTANTRTIVYQ